jgi:hypothetical protein
MTSSEFVIWLKGFVVASNNYNLTPSAWDELKIKLNEVKDNKPIFNSITKDTNGIWQFTNNTINNDEGTINNMP